jgi:hemerythrin-like domain-containing protein
MKNINRNGHISLTGFENKRRDFLKKGLILGTLTGVSGLGLIASCKKESEEDVTPAEDLMREHGLLTRILLIYDFLRKRLINNEEVDLTVLKDPAQIIRSFVEDYHEKLEEDYLFPRFEKANQLTDLVHVLRTQHKAGRVLTDRILQLSDAQSQDDTNNNQEIIRLLSDFNSMYCPHASREDTVLFPAIKNIVSANEYFAMGEEFEDKEHQLFGEDGFESMVDKVADIEKKLGIYDLSKFTPTSDPISM